ncbi:MAG TPA: 3-keto-5-aminohexanoate cleavage protein [Solirubrobacteraceae bacterium]|nr:3-keto-5-aminohexanoate cleavage protein [Solirubrobacteraceae bacterium]
MIQCALNGSYTREDHPDVPVTVGEIVADAVACQAAGAPSVHFHPRRPDDGRESLAAEVHDAVVAAVRAAAPDLELSCSTQEDIDLGGAPDRVAAIRAWTHPPDLVSLNLTEDGVLELGAALLDRGIGIEAGVFTLEGADARLAAPWAERVQRVLVEVTYEHDDRAAVVDAGLAAGVDVRVGLEDTLYDRDGGPAPSNPGQVAAVR